MVLLIAVLDGGDYLIIASLVFVAATAASLVARQQINLDRVERKLDLLLKHEGIVIQTKISPEVQQLARDPSNKIAAIKLHRSQNPGLGLAEAKRDIEDFSG